MSSGSHKRVSFKDIDLVHNLIENCLLLYMSQKETVDKLLNDAKIECGFTEAVWHKLEAENQEFFSAYYLKLLVKQQIMKFNALLEKQKQMIDATLQVFNRPHIPAITQNPACYAGEQTQECLKPENIQHPVGSGFQKVFNNGWSSVYSSTYPSCAMSTYGNGINGPSSTLSACSPYIDADDGNFFEELFNARQTIGNAMVSSFANMQPNSYSVNEEVFGIFNQIPEYSFLSDSTTDFRQSSGIMQNYARLPLLDTYNGNFLESGQQVGSNRLDPKKTQVMRVDH